MSVDPTAVSPERWFAIMMSVVLLGSAEHLRGQQTSLTEVDATGFEREDGWCPGFACGPAFDGCFDPAADASVNCGVENPNEATGWYLSNDSLSCAQPHISTDNPRDGEQHLRFVSDPLLATECFSFNEPCPVNEILSRRMCGEGPVPGDAPCLEPLEPGPTTVTLDVYATCVHAASLTIRMLGPSRAMSDLPFFRFDPAFGTIVVGDPRFQLFADTGIEVAPGGYNEVKIEVDPCNRETRYWFDGWLARVTPLPPGVANTIEQVSLVADNTVCDVRDPGGYDVDNFRIERGPPCDTVCGDDVAEAWEECDGSDDAVCRGRCAAPGESNECICRPLGDTPAAATPVFAGTQSFQGHGGWFVYQSKTPAFGVSTCGTSVANTMLRVWSVDVNGDRVVAENDDCDDGPRGSGSDPLAACYNRRSIGCHTPRGVFNPADCELIENHRCAGGVRTDQPCDPDNGDADCRGHCVGQSDPPRPCDDDQQCSTAVCLSGPRVGLPCTLDADCVGRGCSDCPTQPCEGDLDCGPEGACVEHTDLTCGIQGRCSMEGRCERVAILAGFVDRPFESCTCVENALGRSFLFQLDAQGELPGLSDVTINIDRIAECGSRRDTGMCCDEVNDTCRDGLTNDLNCQGDTEVFTPNQVCNGLTCIARRGACCDLISGLCVNDQLEPDCNALTQSTWTLNTNCVDVSCFAAGGACCNSVNGLPGAASCESTTLANCQCAACTWIKGGSCADFESEGLCLINPIPTVSEWGLVILTLLLLTGAKIYFGRRRVVTA